MWQALTRPCYTTHEEKKKYVQACRVPFHALALGRYLRRTACAGPTPSALINRELLALSDTTPADLTARPKAENKTLGRGPRGVDALDANAHDETYGRTRGQCIKRRLLLVGTRDNASSWRSAREVGRPPRSARRSTTRDPVLSFSLFRWNQVNGSDGHCRYRLRDT